MPTVDEALADWRSEAGFDADGGLERWVDWIVLLGVPLPVPNLPARRAAVPYHDLSHLLTGYGTDWRGEFEESAYEIASGTGGNWFAQLINLHGMVGGLLLIPRRTLAAYRRGLVARSAYELNLSEVGDCTLDELRARLHVDNPGARWTFARRLQLASRVLLSLASLLSPLLLLFLAMRRGLRTR